MVVSLKKYDILEVSRDATTEEIRRSYKKLAVKLHPDKVGDTPENSEKFQELKNAYDTLNDPSKRKLYDQYGDEGVEMLNNFNNVDPKVVFNAMMEQSPLLKAVIFCIAFTIVIFIILQISFISIRYDNIITWSWSIIFIPIWISLIVVSLFIIFVMPSDSSKSAEEAAHKAAAFQAGSSSIPKWLSLILLVIFITQMIFLSLYFDKTITWDAFVIYGPWIIFEFTLIMYRLLAYSSRFQAFLNGQPKNYENKYSIVFFVYSDNIWGILRLLFVILIAAKLDSYLGTLTWMGVFIPIWIGFLLSFIEIIVRCCTLKPSKDKAYLNSTDSEKDDQNDDNQSKVIGSFCFLISIFIIILLFAIKLDKTGAFQMIIVFTPILIMFSCACMCAVCGICLSIAIEAGIINSKDKPLTPQNSRNGENRV